MDVPMLAWLPEEESASVTAFAAALAAAALGSSLAAAAAASAAAGCEGSEAPVAQLTALLVGSVPPSRPRRAAASCARHCAICIRAHMAAVSSASGVAPPPAAAPQAAAAAAGCARSACAAAANAGAAVAVAASTRLTGLRGFVRATGLRATAARASSIAAGGVELMLLAATAAPKPRGGVSPAMTRQPEGELGGCTACAAPPPISRVLKGRIALRLTFHTVTIESRTEPARSCSPGETHMSARRLQRISVCS